VNETIPGYTYSGWNGIAVPRGTPAPIVERIRAALMKTIALPEVKEAFGKQGAAVVTNTSEEFRRMVQSETEATAGVVKAAKVQVN
jgi:tripartite-type tricarboxylate transporter receptor subunit TctC